MVPPQRKSLESIRRGKEGMRLEAIVECFEGENYLVAETVKLYI